MIGVSARKRISFSYAIFCLQSIFAKSCDFRTCDVPILLDFKAHITADPLGVLSNWEVNFACGIGWTGVLCDNTGRASSINLLSKELSGSIPPSIGGLVNLKQLLLSSNQFSGPIPSSLGNLTNLEYLELASNQLSGQIPSTLGSLRNIQYLFLFSNHLSGSIPSSLGSLANLQLMGLYSNQLTGPIPYSFGNLRSVTKLYLYSNQLNGSIPSSLGNLASLADLELSNNQLSGSLPSSLGNLAALQYLFLNENQLSGAIPSSLGNLRNLKLLYLFSNRLTGSIPPSLGDLANLQQMALYSNQLSGSIPSSFGKLTQLQYLYMYYNNLTGSIPSSLGSLTNLVQLQLSANQLSGSIPSSFGNLTSLKLLYLSLNRLTGRIPSTLGNLVNLQQLSLYFNQLSGPIPSSLGSLTNLQYLYTYENQLSGPIPSSFGGLSSLLALDMSFNQLSGPIPPTLGVLINLEYLHLFSNRLSGAIPSSLGNLVNLVEMGLYLNRLSGAIPSSLGNLGNVQRLYLYSNQLSGSIPSSLGNLYSLTDLELSDNQLSGSIPSSIGSLPNLKYLYLFDNYLNGDVPDTVASRCTSGGFTFAYFLNCLSSLPRACGTGAQRLSTSCTDFNRNKVAIQYGLSFLTPKYKTQFQGTFFRHASAGFISYGNGQFAWEIETSLNWANVLSTWSLKEQSLCDSCWVAASVSAIEAAYAVTLYSSASNYASNPPPALSIQQVIDCEGTGSCAGGWPQNALEYSASLGVVLESYLPYAGRNGTCAVPKGAARYGISHYEVVDFYGWIGFLIAVNQQPIVVSVEGSSPYFSNYQGGILSSKDCYVNGVDHSVLLVGYDFTSVPPVWIIRNSWGKTWGENGHVRMAITGGVGICGINTLPGYFPVVSSKSDPCNTKSYGSMFKLNPAPGLLNPCGEFPCKAKGSSYTCNCRKPFVAATDFDGRQTCVPASPCSFFAVNPCGIGNCIDTSLGTYTCLCPLGYAVSTLSFTKKPACVPAVKVPGIQFYTVPAGTAITCGTILQTYRISLQTLLKQNKGLKCSAPLTSGYKLNVTSTSACRVPYATNHNDTCASIKALFKLGKKQDISGPNSPNPNLDCAHIIPGQQICIIPGTPPDYQLCTFPHVPAVGETCASIINSNFAGNATAFFEINQGLYCDKLFYQGIPFEQVCLASAALGSIKKGCFQGKFALVQPGQSCQYLAQKYFNGKLALFAKANRGIVCQNRKLYAGMAFCTKSP